MLYLYNTLSRKKEHFVPKKEGEVSLYSCGPTVYNTVHIGNIRAFLFADTLQRWMRFGEKLNTKWVMNITDVDDKTIRDSKSEFPELDPNEALKKFTTYYSDIFFEDLEAVNVDRGHFLENPFATDYIDHMQNLVQTIVNNGYGYVSDGSIYFNIEAYRKDYKYGELVNLNFDDMVSTDRVEDDEYDKESFADFVLWKGVKDGEPYWDFELTYGEDVISIPGRPGWHIECSAMSKSLFHDFPFDIHTGGVDLCFPHHEDEICQARAAYGLDTARFWCHNEHLMVEGKKMSKSLGNFYTLKDLKEKGFDPEVIRFFLVTNHYRKKVNLSEDSLNASGKMLQKMKVYKMGLVNQKGEKEVSVVQCEEMLSEFLSEFYSAMQDDLNVSVAIAKAFSFLKEVSTWSLNEDQRQELLTNVELVEKVFGVSFSEEERKDEVPDNVMDLVRQRDVARSEKNWILSDEIRDQLRDMGYTVVDGANGTEIFC